MSRAHDKALLAVLSAIPALKGKVFPTQVPRDPAGAVTVPPPYVVVQPADGTDDTDRLAGPRLRQNPSWTIHSAGTTTDQAKWAAEQVKNQLVNRGLGIHLTVPGERPGRIRYESPVPVRVDTTVVPPVHVHTATVGFTSDPA
ncbi:hypothetical protein M2390_002927 [Mycetocola sp. BIGb0189]|uniref:hypothetical protein n=1 Tax=Mycetocola sp. BIGb0189 TaxID=2940604 RepID=UPI002166CC27|nr:hypothetical protein [Mycetocola sp. BIGb0189]MCS4277718.1 hypothetical protein [Mycetocola sp. BIGb0189]